MDLYEKAVQSLQISIFQEVVNGEPAESPQFPYQQPVAGTLGGGKETDSYDQKTFVVTLPQSEGVPFVCLQTSVEDARGVLAVQNQL